MHVQRRPSRRGALPYIGCGCLALLTTCLIVGGIGIVLLLPSLPGFALQAVGFQPQGQTDSVFAEVTQIPPAPLQNPVVPGQVVIELGAYGSEPRPPTFYDYPLAVGSDPTGARVASAAFSEATLMALCRERLSICSPAGNGQIRNTVIDLRPGGAVVYAEVFVPQLATWQNLGAVLRLDASGRRFTFAGVDINGALYAAPPAGMGLDNIGAEIERVGNDVLRQLALNTGDARFELSRAYIDDSTLTLTLE